MEKPTAMFVEDSDPEVRLDAYSDRLDIYRGGTLITSITGDDLENLRFLLKNDE